MERLIKSVVVTGASSGIGFSVSEVLTRKGYRVFGSVRTGGDALRLKSLLGERFEPLPMDVASKESVKSAAEMVRRRLNATNLHGLVNNAGIVVNGPLMEIDEGIRNRGIPPSRQGSSPSCSSSCRSSYRRALPTDCSEECCI